MARRARVTVDAATARAARAFRDEDLDLYDLERVVHPRVASVVAAFRLGVVAWDQARLWHALKLEPVYQRVRAVVQYADGRLRPLDAATLPARGLYDVLNTIRPVYHRVVGRPKRRPTVTQARTAVVRALHDEVRRQLRVDDVARVNELTTDAARALYPDVCGTLTTKQVRDVVRYQPTRRKMGTSRRT